MALKKYQPRGLELEPVYQMQFSLIIKIFRGGLAPLQKIQSVYSKPQTTGHPGILKKLRYFAAVCIYPTPLLRAGCDRTSFLKRGTIGLNSELSFSLTGCHDKVKEPSLLHYLSIYLDNSRIHTFPTGVNAMWNAQGLVQGLTLGRRFHFLRRYPLRQCWQL